MHFTLCIPVQPRNLAPRMSEPSAPKISKWPFFAADLVLVALGAFIFQRGHNPLQPFELAGVIACAVIGAWCFIKPFLHEYDAVVKFAESASLTDTVRQIQGVEQVAQEITSAQNFLQTIQKENEKVAVAAKEIGDRMTQEAKNFAEFMKTTNDAEKSHLRLEVDKLRRAEGDWLQVLVRILDNTFALHHAAVLSGQQNVISQIGQFQFTIRDAARRVGLQAYGAEAGEAFDPQKHHPADGKLPEGPATIEGASAPGYTFQGRVIRPTMVVLAGSKPAEAPAAPAPTETSTATASEQKPAGEDGEPRLL